MATKGTRSSTKKGTASRGASKSRPRASTGDHLVVVESPAKARTIERMLGSTFTVRASQGHVRDLPKGKLGVNVEEGFSPSYLVTKDKEPIIQELKKLGGKASSIYLATDPDREGEAIAWHIANAAGWEGNGHDLQRVVFHEITQEAVQESFKHPRTIDMELVNAQQARRILDRLVGYQISPLLWRKVQRGLSAGRVQSVALRMVVDREKEINAFVPVEHWSIEAKLHKDEKKAKPFTATLHSVKGERGKLNIPDSASAEKVRSDLDGAEYKVDSVKKREVKQSPAPPFITSTLQQEAYRKLRFSTKRTMAVAQQLYEGLAVGQEGSVGLITYMRTDSVQVNPGSIREAREYIAARYGAEYIPAQPRAFRKKSKGAQEAHEAIRPTSILREPAQIRSHLTSDQARLYNLIWQRMLASQMADAKSDSTTVDIGAKCIAAPKTYTFRAVGTVLKFPGFRTLYLEGKDDSEGDEGEGKTPLPELSQNDLLNLMSLEPKQHFTQPPARYSEATLVKALEEMGIGRPSTYAPIISTISDRQYVEKEEGRLKPTILGTTVSDLLVEHFSSVMDMNFTAKMEEDLDEVAQGDLDMEPMLQEFYTPFKEALDAAEQAMPRVKIEEATEEVCQKCGNSMVIKTGRFGRFLACTNFPACRNTRPLAADGKAQAPDGQVPAEPEDTGEICDKCGKPMQMRSGRYGRFIACTDYPTCKSSKPILNKIGVACPKCGSEIVERRSRKKGRPFFGCSSYPKCDYVSNQRPLPEPCPECGGLMVASGTKSVKCTNCTWTEKIEKTKAMEPASAR